MGRATALTFAEEGASVVGCDVSVEAAQETTEMVVAGGAQMISMQPCHLADSADCRALVDLAVRTFGRIDVLFNLAAVSRFNKLEGITDLRDESDRAGMRMVMEYLAYRKIVR